jgi:hypothetical protein
MSRVACPVKGPATSVFNGTYFVSDGSGKYSESCGGTGAFIVSQTGASGTSQGAVSGSLQKIALQGCTTIHRRQTQAAPIIGPPAPLFPASASSVTLISIPFSA